MPELPPSFAARAASLSARPGAVTACRDAATVVLLREGDLGLEVYLMRRVAAMSFAAGMHVFPGGSVDPRDADLFPAWVGPSPARWADWLGCDEALAQALVCAAVRETFEESGVLLAGPAGQPHELVPDTTSADWEADRLALLDRSLALADLMASRDLALRADLLRPWAHWVTPEFEPKRFDTRFFVAALPPGQRTRDVGGEADHVAWHAVPDAVRGYESGSLAMLPPTAATLRELSTYADQASVLSATRSLTRLLPRPVPDPAGGIRLVVDGPHGEQDADLPVR